MILPYNFLYKLVGTWESVTQHWNWTEREIISVDVELKSNQDANLGVSDL